MGEKRNPACWSTNRRQILAAASALGAIAGCTSLTNFDNSSEFGFENGVKIGQVTPTSARIWTRLSRQQPATRRATSFRFRPAQGEVRLVAWPTVRVHQLRTRDWRSVDPSEDGTVQFELTDLEPATTYHFLVEGRRNGIEPEVEYGGRFRTAPAPTEPTDISFGVVSCQAWRFREPDFEGFETYDTLAEMEPDFFVHTGDMVYYDQGNLIGKTVENARSHWHRMYGQEGLKEFHSQTPSYFLKDDHDILDNDSWPGQRYGELTFEEGVRIFNEQNPTGEVPYRTVRWGEDLQIWLPEMREYRSPHTMPDGPEKTILGDEQIEWLRRTIPESDATFRVVIAPSIFVGPDRPNKSDNLANEGFSTEGSMLREFLAENDVVVIGGDRHWEYVSVHEGTGLWEFGCGPLAKGREGGWDEDDVRPEHRFLAVKPGFLRAAVEQEDGEPVLTVRHHGPDGATRHTERFTGEPLEAL